MTHISELVRQLSLPNHKQMPSGLPLNGLALNLDLMRDVPLVVEDSLGEVEVETYEDEEGVAGEVFMSFHTFEHVKKEDAMREEENSQELGM